MTRCAQNLRVASDEKLKNNNCVEQSKVFFLLDTVNTRHCNTIKLFGRMLFRERVDVFHARGRRRATTD